MENILSGPVPNRIPESLRASRSDEDLCPSPTPFDAPVRSLIPITTESGDLIDDHDCWSQDDDDIITVSSSNCLLFYVVTLLPF